MFCILIVAVNCPPNVAAPEIVTKSFSFAPCAGSITVIVVDPLVAEKVISPSCCCISKWSYIIK